VIERVAAILSGSGTTQNPTGKPEDDECQATGNKELDQDTTRVAADESASKNPPLQENTE